MNARRMVHSVWLALPILAAACGQVGHIEREANGMKASTTYLYLLRKTPFFTQLDARQLRWTIAHSREWEAQAGTVITHCIPGQQNDDFWILLDGGWQVEHGTLIYPSGHADAGKWFNASALSGDCRLVVTTHSYVMKISRTDMDQMLSRGFAFESHLQQGRAYYGNISGATLSRP